MNDVLQLKGHFEKRDRAKNMGPRNIPRGKYVAVDHLVKLRSDLLRVYDYWKDDTVLNEKLVSVHYNCIIAKSNRMQGLLRTTNESIVGAKFTDDEFRHHIITHRVSLDVIQKSIETLASCIRISSTLSKKSFSYDDIERINHQKLLIDSSEVSRSAFVSILVDAYYIDRFDVDRTPDNIEGAALITIYNTGLPIAELMSKLQIDWNMRRSLDETTLFLTRDQYDQLKLKAPYLIAMSVTDLAKMPAYDVAETENESISIPEPKNEPTVGVIDTLFDEHVYFHKWVTYQNMVSPDIKIEADSYDHGTRVTSIIVDGPSLNPELDDGCGRFQVRHFGVAANGRFSSFTILHDIQEIIQKNKDIKVWNLSLGSELPINNNFISPEAAILDKIQYENDVLFVIAGTNNNHPEKGSMKIGAPADSINAVVVNAVDSNNNPASYTRDGPVLSFFTKPDVCCFGGDENKRMKTYGPNGIGFVSGTSFAAPWIARKLAYLIQVVGLRRDVAKALLIDSAAGWQKSAHPSFMVGHGIVPQKIDDIVKSQNDEIRFVIADVSEKYDTYNYNIPVPIAKEQQPYIAKATLCYFPECSRNQGVDYTDTELDFHFGRVTDSGIKAINGNEQCDDKIVYLKEEEARKYYRKWDNVKHIGEELTGSKKARKLYNNGMWGISLKETERLGSLTGKKLNFGIVITLKEINGVNRIDEFIRQCSLKGWLVNKINVENQVDIYNQAEADVEFEK